MTIEARAARRPRLVVRAHALAGKPVLGERRRVRREHDPVAQLVSTKDERREEALELHVGSESTTSGSTSSRSKRQPIRTEDGVASRIRRGPGGRRARVRLWRRARADPRVRQPCAGRRRRVRTHCNRLRVVSVAEGGKCPRPDSGRARRIGQRDRAGARGRGAGLGGGRRSGVRRRGRRRGHGEAPADRAARAGERGEARRAAREERRGRRARRGGGTRRPRREGGRPGGVPRGARSAGRSRTTSRSRPAWTRCPTRASPSSGSTWQLSRTS